MLFQYSNKLGKWIILIGLLLLGLGLFGDYHAHGNILHPEFLPVYASTAGVVVIGLCKRRRQNPSVRQPSRSVAPE